MQALGLLIVDDLVGLQRRSVVVDLNAANRRDARVVVIVVDLGGLDEHLPVIGPLVRRLFGRPGRELVVPECLLRRCRRHVGNTEAEGHTQSQNGRHDRALTAQANAPPERRRPSLEGGDNGHYPSSWYSKAKNPERPPTQTGNHAAASGCINSALLKSSVTFDRT